MVGISGYVTDREGDFSLKVGGGREAFDDPQITPYLSLRPGWLKIGLRCSK